VARVTWYAADVLGDAAELDASPTLVVRIASKQ